MSSIPRCVPSFQRLARSISSLSIDDISKALTPGIRVAFSPLIWWCVSGATIRIMPLFDLRARDPNVVGTHSLERRLDFGFKLRKSTHQQIDDTGQS